MAKRPPASKKKRPAKDGAPVSVAEVLAARQSELLAQWLVRFRDAAGTQGLASTAGEELHRQAAQVLCGVTTALAAENPEEVETPQYCACVDALRQASARRAEQGASPTEMAAFVFTLKDPLLRCLQEEIGGDPDQLTAAIVKMNAAIDRLGMIAFDAFARSREDVVSTQSRSLLELSTPALKVWDRLLLVPLIGVIDTARAQQIMETLLRSIVATESEVVILDITGVSVVDTRVAHSLVKTVAGAKMLGAETIITGIRPEVALTLTKAGPPLQEIRTCGSLRAGIAMGFAILGLQLQPGVA